MSLAQISALLWKNFRLRYRSWGSCILEIAFPVFMCYLIAFMHTKMEKPRQYSNFVPEQKLSSTYGYTVYFQPESPATLALAQGWADEKAQFLPRSNDSKDALTTKHYVFIQLDDESVVPKDLKFLAVRSIPHDTDVIYGDSKADYLFTGVQAVQHTVTKVFINYWLKNLKLATPPPIEDFSVMGIPPRPMVSSARQTTLPMISKLLVLLFFGLSALTAQSIVYEKESKIKESMKLMGLQTFSFWFTWFITSFVFGFFVCIIFTVTFCILTYENGPILYSDPVFIMTALTLYVINIISFCCMLSCFVNKGRNAAIGVGTLYFVLKFASPLTFSYLRTKSLAHLGGCLLFQSGIGYFIDMLMVFEGREAELNFNSMQPYYVLPHVNVLDSLVMLVTNTVFNCFVVWYMDNVYPGEYGIPQPYHFFLTRNYWCPVVESTHDLPEMPHQDVRFFEKPTENLKPGMQIRNLVKVFNGQTAMCGITLDLYKDRITVLLGHNGAGKTTTINMITGFLKPTSGTAIVNGFDITKNLKEARKNVGLCPQHDILFPTLTCEEHLIFYSKLKEHYDGVNAKKDIDQLLEEVNLTDKKKCYSSVLSGGQKRKLSVACSFIGGSQIVFLDEPSSGLDPSARRELWDFLKKKREGRTILLTTHYMDEADILGDRIVIMAEGVVKCYGTSNFLKRIYGTGYQMNIDKLPNCNVREVTATIKKHIPEVDLTHQTNTELFYLLPEKDVPLYSKMMLELEKKRSELKIDSFGVVATSLEDVFVRVGKGFEPKSFLDVDNSNAVDVSPSDSPALDSPILFYEVPLNINYNQSNDEETPVRNTEESENEENITQGQTAEVTKESTNSDETAHSLVQNNKVFDQLSDYTQLTGRPLLLHQLRAIFIKKFILFKSNKLFSVVLVLLPVVLVYIGIASDERSQSSDKSEDMYFTLDRFRSDLVIPLFYLTHRKNSSYRREYANLAGKFGTVKEYDVDQKDENDKSLYGVVKESIENDTRDVSYTDFKERYLFGVVLTGFYKTVVLNQRSAVHMEGIAMQLAMDAWVKASLGRDYSVQTGLRHEDGGYRLYERHQAATFFCFGFSMALVPVLFIYPLVQERAVGARHLQSLSGVSPIAYWLGTFSFDVIIYLVIVVMLMVSFLNKPAVYIRQTRWFLTLTVLLIYGLAMFPYLYASQFLFRNPSRAVVSLLMITIFIGIVASFVMTGLRAIIAFEGAFYLTHLAFTLICPNYSLTSTFLFFLVIAGTYDPEIKGTTGGRARIGQVSEPSLKEYFEFSFEKLYFYENLVSMVLVTAVSWVIVGLVEYRVDRLLWYVAVPDCGCLYRAMERRPSTQEDDDVKMERVKISTTPLDQLLRSNVIVMHNLRKHYLIGCKLFVAVHGTSVCLPPNECLGLLGQNGAGKSTTFKMLTGDEGVTSGDAYINGLNIKRQMKKIQTMMGYCPQQDALHDTLTGRETLYLYARIRGVPESSLGAVVQTVIDFVVLSPHDNKITQYYSGGNKRKLSVGISIIGNPKFIMLDEPTAGMDPVARRKLWDIMHLLRASGKTLVLTSHSMEECEALCTRIAIMVHGYVLCLGSSQHLKSKYGKGYTVILHASKDAEGKAMPLSQVERYVLDTISHSQIFAKQEAYTDIQIPENVPLSFIFEVLEKAKGQFKFQYYTVQQTSLEQVFLRLLKVEDSTIV